MSIFPSREYPPDYAQGHRPRTARIEQWRAYLLAASLVALPIQLFVIVSILFFHLPEATFMSTRFRLGVVIGIVSGVLVIRRSANDAFRSALAHHHAMLDEGQPPIVRLSSNCPRRLRVILYVRLNGNRYDLSYL